MTVLSIMLPYDFLNQCHTDQRLTHIPTQARAWHPTQPRTMNAHKNSRPVGTFTGRLQGLQRLIGFFLSAAPPAKVVMAVAVAVVVSAMLTVTVVTWSVVVAVVVVMTVVMAMVVMSTVIVVMAVVSAMTSTVVATMIAGFSNSGQGEASGEGQGDKGFGCIFHRSLLFS